MMKTQRSFLAISLLLVLPTLAHAHHAMGGATPSTLFEGLLSGLAHPVIGLDHLLFVLAIGAACYAFRRGAGTVAAYLGAALLGVAIHLNAVTVPYADAWVAATLIAAGVMLLRASPSLGSALAPAFFALAGVAHGYAYGESIVGAETTPLAAYLTGFTLVQAAIASAGYAIARALDRRGSRFSPKLAFGGALSVAGAVFLALSLA